MSIGLHTKGALAEEFREVLGMMTSPLEGVPAGGVDCQSNIVPSLIRALNKFVRLKCEMRVLLCVCFE